MPDLFAYSDGACSGNPGPGGWGVVMEARDAGRLVKSRELSGAEPDTTNNRMELMAAIGALEALTRPSTITIVTDSNYLRHGITDWIRRWKRNGWRTAGGKPVKNADLWQRLDAAAAQHKVKWQWIKGHSGHDQNERADRLARAEIKALKRASGKLDPDELDPDELDPDELDPDELDPDELDPDELDPGAESAASSA